MAASAVDGAYDDVEGSLYLPVVSLLSGLFWHVIQLVALIACQGYHVVTTNIPVNRMAGQVLSCQM